MRVSGVNVAITCVIGKLEQKKMYYPYCAHWVNAYYGVLLYMAIGTSCFKNKTNKIIFFKYGFRKSKCIKNGMNSFFGGFK